MAFNSFKFQYTPPPTVSAPVPVNQESSQAISSLLTSSPADAQSSVANSLIERAQELQATNQFLQTVVLARTSGITIPFNAAADPDTAEAIAKLYPGLPVPTSLSVTMYNHLLDAELATLQIDRALAGGTEEVNPVQAAAISQIVDAIENGILDGGQYDSMLALLLRQLKGDNVFFNGLTSALSGYPAVSSPAASVAESATPSLITLFGQDISPDLAGTLTSAYDSFQGSYASVYQLCASVGQVAQDATLVLTKFFVQPAADLVRMMSMLQTLMAFRHFPSLKSVVKGLTGFVFIQLMVEACTMAVMADRFVKAAVQPIRTMTGEIGQLVNYVQVATSLAETTVNGVKQLGTFPSGALQGMSQSYNCGMPHNANAKKPSKTANAFTHGVGTVEKGLNKVDQGLGVVSKGLANVAQNLDWASTVVMRKIFQMDEAFHKLIERRLFDMNTQLDLLCSLQALQTITQLGMAVLSFNRTPQQSAGTAGFNQLQQVGMLLNTVSSSIGTTYITANGQVQAVLPTLPTPTNQVQSTLVKGGLDVTVVSSTGVAHAS